MRPGAARAAALVLAGLLASCRRPGPETRFLNFDPESSRGALVSGWSGFEKEPTGDTFVWCQSRHATLAVAEAGTGGRLLRFRCWPYRWAGAPPQSVTLSVNGRHLETLALADGPRVYAVATPAEVWRRGRNLVRLDFAYAEAPRDRVAGASDARTLAAAFDWLEVVPYPDASAGG